MKRQRKVFLCITLLFMIFLLAEAFFHRPFLLSLLTDSGRAESEHEIGDVEVGHRLYFMDGAEAIEGRFVEVDPEASDPALRYKRGVYEINITDRDSDNFIEKLRIDISVKSDVDTYIRVKLVSTMILRYSKPTGSANEIQVIGQDQVVLNVGSGWYKNGDYYYYTAPVKKEGAEDLVIPFIIDYFEGTYFSPYPENYSIQLGVVVDAVQALGGPQNHWNLKNPPWGGDWE